MTPLDTAVGAEGSAAALEHGLELLVDVEALRDRQQLVSEAHELRGGDAGLDVGTRRRGEGRHQLVGGDVADLVVGLLQLGADALAHLLDLGGRHHAFGDELLRVDRRHARVLVDCLVHQRLRVARLVALVVAPAAVADQVDQDVLAEAGAVGHGEAHGGAAGIDVVGVDVDDRHVVALGDVGAVTRRAAIARIGREADLVVRDDVQRATHLVAGQALQVEGLGDDALAGECRVAVDLHGECALRVEGRVGRLLPVGLERTGAADDDGVDELEVRGVRQQREAHLARHPGLDFELADAGSAVVVLDVAGTAGRHQRLDEGVGLTFELSQDLRVGEPQHVRLDVEAATVRHAQRDLLDASARGEQHGLVEHQDHRVEPLDGELLGAEEGALQERLKALNAQQADQLTALLLRGSFDPEGARLDGLAQPDALAVGAEVLDLVGDRLAVDLGESIEDGLERVALDEGAQRGGRHGFERALVKFEERRVECGVAGWLRAEWVELRGEVPVGAVRLDQRHAGAHVGEQLLGAHALRERADRLGAVDARTPRPRRLRGGLAARVGGLLGRCRHRCGASSKP